MGILERLGAAWKIMRGQAVAYPKRGGMSQKAWSYHFPSWRDPSWELADTTYEGYVRDGYERNAVIFGALIYKVKALSGVRLRAYIGDPESPEPAPPDHPLAKLVARPNKHQSFLEMQSVSTVYFNLAGNSYQVLDRERSGELPMQILPMRPDRMFPIPTNSGLSGYVYRPEGKSIYDTFPVLETDVMHVKYPNPADPYEGMGVGLSLMKPLARSGDVDNAFTDYLKQFTERGFILDGILKFDIEMTSEEMARVKQVWRDQHGGMDNWGGDIGVLDSGGDYQRLTPTFQEMDFSSIDTRNESRMLMPLGVPAILIGTRYGLERSTFSNHEEARRAFWQDTMLPELRWFEEEYNHFLRTEDGGFVKFDLSQVKALQGNIKEQSEAVKNLWMAGMPLNMALRRVGLHGEDVPGGDMPRPMGNAVGGDVAKANPSLALDGELIEMSLGNPSPTPIEKPKALPSGKVVPPDVMGGEKTGAHGGAPLRVKGAVEGVEPTSDEEKQRIWEKQDGIAIDHEGAFQDAAVERFEEEEREVLAIIYDQQEKARRLKQGPIQWEEAAEDLKEFYDAAGEDWRDTFAPLLQGVYEDVGDFWSMELGIAFDVRNLRGEEWFEDYLLVFSDPITTTSHDTLHDLLAQGQAEGWSIQQMQDAIEQTFQQWISGNVSSEDYEFVQRRLPPFRTEMIARTETTRAVNAGTYQIGREWDVERKEWLATSDDRTRDSHADADGQIAWLDDPFDVGGYEMMYPGDAQHGAPPSEFVNCRCTHLLRKE